MKCAPFNNTIRSSAANRPTLNSKRWHRPGQSTVRIKRLKLPFTIRNWTVTEKYLSRKLFMAYLKNTSCEPHSTSTIPGWSQHSEITPALCVSQKHRISPSKLKHIITPRQSNHLEERIPVLAASFVTSWAFQRSPLPVQIFSASDLLTRPLMNCLLVSFLPIVSPAV